MQAHVFLKEKLSTLAWRMQQHKPFPINVKMQTLFRGLAGSRPFPTLRATSRRMLHASPRAAASPQASEQSGGPPAHMQKIKSSFCRSCGSRMQLVQMPTQGVKDEWRHTCTNVQGCGAIEYFNPRMVCGAIAEHEGKILLCRRAIEPCLGKWTIPAGFMELNESSAEGAARETQEEAGCQVQIIAPYAHWDIPVIGQAYILFRAKILPPYTIASKTSESLETRMFDPADIPFDDIAFSSISLALRYYCEDVKNNRKWRMHHGVIEKKPGAAPNDPGTFQVRDLMSFQLSS